MAKQTKSISKAANKEAIDSPNPLASANFQIAAPKTKKAEPMPLALQKLPVHSDTKMVLSDANISDSLTMKLVAKSLKEGSTSERELRALVKLSEKVRTLTPTQLVRYSMKHKLPAPQAVEAALTAEELHTSPFHIAKWTREMVSRTQAEREWLDLPIEKKMDTLHDTEGLISHWKDVNELAEDISFEQYLKIFYVRPNVDEVKALIEAIYEMRIQEKERSIYHGTIKYPFLKRISFAIKMIEEDSAIELDEILEALEDKISRRERQMEPIDDMDCEDHLRRRNSEFDESYEE